MKLESAGLSVSANSENIHIEVEEFVFDFDDGSQKIVGKEYIESAFEQFTALGYGHLISDNTDTKVYADDEFIEQIAVILLMGSEQVPSIDTVNKVVWQKKDGTILGKLPEYKINALRSAFD